MKRVILGLSMVVLAGCATPMPLPSATDGPPPPTMTPTPSPSPVVVLPEPHCSIVDHFPPSELTCEKAVEAALLRAALTSSPASIRFEYGRYCGPGQFCPAGGTGDVAYVVIEGAGERGDLLIEVTLEDFGPEVVVEAGPVEPLPTES